MPDQLQGIVQKMIDAGESEDNIATVIQHFKTQAPAQPQVRSRTGQMYTPPVDDGSDFLKGAASNVDPRGYMQLAKDAYNDPLGTAKNVALSPIRLAGQLITNPERTAGQLTGAIGLNAGLGFLRTLVNPAAAETIQGVNVADLKAAGVGDAAINATKNGRTPLKFPQPPLRIASKEPPPPTVGNLALKLEPPPPSGPTSQPLGTPRVMTLKDTPTSWTPEAARARIENSQWESGLEPGTAEAQGASGLHKYESEMDSRLKYLMDSENGFGHRQFVASPGRTLSAAAGTWLAHKLGLPPYAGGAAGYMAPEIAIGGAQAATSPAGAAALRAALLARLTSGTPDTSAGPR